MVKLGNIVAGHVFWAGKHMFRKQNLCPRSKYVFDLRQKHFSFFRAAKFVSATYVSRAAKLGNICLRNNVSATLFPSLARLLGCILLFLFIIILQ